MAAERGTNPGAPASGERREKRERRDGGGPEKASTSNALSSSTGFLK